MLPGYGGADGSTAVIRSYLRQQGHAAWGWELGRNRGATMAGLERSLPARLDALWRQGGERKISLVGWSLGGVYARRLAQRLPGQIRQVITLGSPIGGAVVRDGLPGVPGTAVYSRTDGVVPWRFARQAVTETAENVEVHGSHLGLGFNASVLYLLADRLAQPEDGWKPFARSGWKRWVYGPALD